MSGGWLVGHSAEGDKRIICFPPAAGRADLFRAWEGLLGDGVELFTVNLPGRDRRLAEPLRRDALEVARALHAEYLALPPRPTVFFGHSLGGLLAYLLTRELMERGGPLPRQLMVAGSRAPHLLKEVRPMLHKLPRVVLIEALRRMGGTSEEVLASTELMELFEPIVRADAALSETYQHQPGPRLPLPIVAFAGTQDPIVPRAQLEAWAGLTSAGFSLVDVEGDHFFPRAASFPPFLRRSLRFDPPLG